MSIVYDDRRIHFEQELQKVPPPIGSLRRKQTTWKTLVYLLLCSSISCGVVRAIAQDLKRDDPVSAATSGYLPEKSS